ncbi:MAG: formyltransferase family protein [Candidatus Thermoplasmatota archaeon]|jgi:phosphoribosylglycinamide formyltransferase-1|nr:formyltransferase family protein [Candidatus Thermoplasmatota archaeon]
MNIPLFTPRERPMRVAIMMSGSGTNAVKIIEYARAAIVTSYEVVILFSENPESNTEKIGQRYGLPTKVNDRKRFFRESGKKGYEARRLFDGSAADLFCKNGVDLVVLAGYNWFVTEAIHHNFPTLNVHPADLRPLDGNGERKYAGGIGHQPIMNAIIGGENFIHSTVHMVTEVPDGGGILMTSDAVAPVLPNGISLEMLIAEGNPGSIKRTAVKSQERLKEEGDWKIFPKTLELISRGRYTTDELGKIYLDGKLIPDGIEYGKVI